MVTLRTVIGLTQVGLAQFLGISRGAVQRWEAGSSYPKAEHLKQLIALGIERQAFAPEREEEEIRALWQAAHQKLLLDEVWLSTLLGERPSPLLRIAPGPIEGTREVNQPVVGPAQGRLGLLLKCLRERRALLVLDNLEALLQEAAAGMIRPSGSGIFTATNPCRPYHIPLRFSR